MRIVVFSGTTEGRDFSRAAAALGIAVTVSVATDLGAEEQGQAPGITVHSGRLLPGAMAELLQGAALCVDATHPYAVEATKNIRAAANAAGVEYHRLLRAASTLPAGSVVLGSAAQAAQYLAATQGNVLLTTAPRSLRPLPGWMPPACTRGCCPPWRALRRARARASRTATLLPCRGPLRWN